MREDEKKKKSGWGLTDEVEEFQYFFRAPMNISLRERKRETDFRVSYSN